MRLLSSEPLSWIKLQELIEQSQARGYTAPQHTTQHYTKLKHIATHCNTFDLLSSEPLSWIEVEELIE